MSRFLIPNIVIVGYGKSQTYQIKCLKCKTQFFPEKKVQVFCDVCRDLANDKLEEYIKEENKSDVKYLGNVIGWENRIGSYKNRSRHNYNKVYKRDGFICQYCNYNPRKYTEFIPMWIDHIIPHSYGGSHKLENLVVSCQQCNQIASDKVFNGFEDKRKYILQKRIHKGLFVEEFLRKVYELT